MSTTAEQLLNAALALPEDDRLQLAEALLVSLQADDEPPFRRFLARIVQRRSAELRVRPGFSDPLGRSQATGLRLS